MQVCAMTTKNVKMTLAILPILLVMALVPSLNSAYAAEDCWDWLGFCEGNQELHSTTSFDVSGVKARVTVPDMTTSSSCSPNDKGFSLIATWIFLPNGNWIEIGVASGDIGGTCYDSEEHHYLAYQQYGNYFEYKLVGSVSPSDYIYYEISDTNNDNRWLAYADGDQRASLIMGHDYGEITVGLESKDDSTSVPKTDVKYIRVHDGSSWSYWTYNDVEDDVNEGFITQCSPAYKNIKVGVGGSETC